MGTVTSIMGHPPSKPPPPRQRPVAKRGGFTLLEMLVALMVFAVIGVMSSRILAGLVDVSEVTRFRSDELADVQRAMYIIERDIEQLTRRTVRDESGQPLLAVTMGEARLLELTRLGWQNPLGAPRSELQRVAYMLEDGRLMRLFWPVLDRATDTQPVTQELLRGVLEAAFTARDDGDKEYRIWPTPAAGDSEERHLNAVQLRLHLETYGRIERLWLVPPGAGFLNRREPGAA